MTTSIAGAPRRPQGLLGLRLFVFAVLLLSPATSHAYAWMVGHGYNNCAQCHTDPSGGGLLTEYGRAQSEILLRTPWVKRSEEWETGPVEDFLFGGVALPENLVLGASSRSTMLRVSTPDSEPVRRFIQMQADLHGQVTMGRVRASGTVGFAPTAAQGAWITRSPENNITSRDHWVGVDVTDDLLVRAGRIGLPYGVRVVEHVFWARSETRTDIDTDQQHGVAVSYNNSGWRTEVMGIAGNFQMSPSDFRERGYSGFLERSLGPKYAVGVSSLMTSASLDQFVLLPKTRQAHGVMARLSPLNHLVVMLEGNLLIQSVDDGDPEMGSTGFVQLDYELFQGLHVVGTREWLDHGEEGTPASSGTWLSTTWFFAPHADIRLDGIRRVIETANSSTPVTIVMGHLHFFL